MTYHDYTYVRDSNIYTKISFGCFRGHMIANAIKATRNPHITFFQPGTAKLLPVPSNGGTLLCGCAPIPLKIAPPIPPSAVTLANGIVLVPIVNAVSPNDIDVPEIVIAAPSGVSV